MKDITVLGIDIAKNIFALFGMNEKGEKVYKKKVKRAAFIETVQQLNVGLVVMEACGGANHWYRVLNAQNVNVQLVSPQHVKAFVKGNKNDFNDAEAIAEAGSRGRTRLFSGKTLEQQDMQSLLRIRERIKHNRTELVNQARGLLAEYGIAIAKGIQKFYKEIVVIVEDSDALLTPMIKHALNKMYTELLNMDEEMTYYEAQLKALYQQNEMAQKLVSIPGVGMYTALGVRALIGDINAFKNGRHMAAYIGLVPRQHSSGGKEKLLGISKRGNSFVRSLMVQGAQSVLRQIDRVDSYRNQRLRVLKERAGHNKTAVAVANKNARIMWAILKYGATYNERLAWGSDDANASLNEVSQASACETAAL